MSFVLYISGCAPEAIGALRALEERDMHPSAMIARAGGALTAGLYACGWRAESLGRLIMNMERGALALLKQALGALRSDIAPSPRDILARVLGDAPALACTGMQPAAPYDGMTALLDELTGGVSLARLRAGLFMPVRACTAEDAQHVGLRLMRSGADTRWALSLAEAMRCAAFPGDMFTSPAVGGCLLSACVADDISCAAEKHGANAQTDAVLNRRAYQSDSGASPTAGAGQISPASGTGICRDMHRARPSAHSLCDMQRELSAAIAGRMLVTIARPGEALPALPAISVALPATGGGMAARMESGYNAMRAQISAICDACL